MNPWIGLYIFMRDFHCLPGTGGYLDQDFLIMDVINEISAVHAREMRKKNG